MDKNQLDGLLALKLVADARNFTAAARTLRVSPSAVSKMIRQLEERLGVTLLTRTTRATSPTEAGERFLLQAGPALEIIMAAMADAGSSAEKPAGRLRLNVPQLPQVGCRQLCREIPRCVGRAVHRERSDQHL
jgi:DNA-binding transcriptional LysR family regulator